MSSPARTIDLNADLGEGQPAEAQLMPLISSASIACGGHIGDERSMAQSLGLATQWRVQAGAHPAWPDREHFGRLPLKLGLVELRSAVRQQLQALQTVAQALGVSLVHVKPHGALYHQAAEDSALAQLLLEETAEAGYSQYYALAGTTDALQPLAQALGLRLVGEGFADRAYGPDGRLWPRTEPGALLNITEATGQALELALSGRVRARDGAWLARHIDTLCLHGDGPEALSLARALREAFERSGVKVSQAVRPVL